MGTDPSFAPPGPGRWALDRSHFPGGTTPIVLWLMEEGMRAGMRDVFAEIGVPASHMEARFVDGFMYTRLIPLVGGDRPPARLPPTFVLRIATRLHPAFRARTKRAASALDGREFADVVDRWETDLRPTTVAENRAFADVDVRTIDDASLDAHVAALLDHNRRLTELHFYLHGHDLGPIARYLHRAIGWGLGATAATTALAGASPSTARPLERLATIRRLLDESGRDVTTIDELRAVSAEIDALVTAHLDEYGDVLATGYDITSFTLRELPAVLLATIRSADPSGPGGDDEADPGGAASLRSEVPAEHRDDFDRHLADARSVMDMRDDNGPVTVEWPLGLLRRALLEVGRRLAERRHIHDADHVFELRPDEARTALVGELPSADELATRAATRQAQRDLDPPTTLGPEEPEPPLDAMPRPLAELVAMVQTALEHLGMDGGTATTVDADTGVGIGRRSYTGRARVARSADEAIRRLEPGDVLVVRATSPAYNAVLTIAGAVVTADGGALSHAAVLARELDIPAVVGASGALDIPDGATVTVDPTAGRVTVAATAG